MYRNSLVVLALAAMMAAGCGEDGSAVEVVDPEQVRLRIVDGDRQVAAVAGVSSGNGASLQAAAVSAQDLLPEPLVVELVEAGSGEVVASMVMEGGGILEPSMASSRMPENLLVRFRVVEEGCGEPFIGTALPDSGQVVDRWIKGTRAGACHMEVARLIDGEPHTDTTFLWTALPGPLDQFRVGLPDTWESVQEVGDTLDLLEAVKHAADAHGNALDVEDLEGGSWAWAVTSRVHGDPANVTPTEPDERGRMFVMPDPAERGFQVSYTGRYAVRVWVWVNGIRADENIATEVQAATEGGA